MLIGCGYPYHQQCQCHRYPHQAIQPNRYSEYLLPHLSELTSSTVLVSTRGTNALPTASLAARVAASCVPPPLGNSPALGLPTLPNLPDSSSMFFFSGGYCLSLATFLEPREVELTGCSSSDLSSLGFPCCTFLARLANSQIPCNISICALTRLYRKYPLRAY